MSTSPGLPLSLASLRAEIRYSDGETCEITVERKSGREALRELISDVAASILHALADSPTGTYIRTLEIFPIETGKNKSGEFTEWAVDSEMSSKWANEFVSRVVQDHTEFILGADVKATVLFEIVKGEGPGIIKITQEKRN